MLNKYTNPRSKRKLKKKAKLQAQAQASGIKPSELLASNIPCPPSPDEIVREMVKPKHSRVEPVTFRKERRLSTPRTAGTKNAR